MTFLYLDKVLSSWFLIQTVGGSDCPVECCIVFFFQDSVLVALHYSHATRRGSLELQQQMRDFDVLLWVIE